jgi:hypothetical protein
MRPRPRLVSHSQPASMLITTKRATMRTSHLTFPLVLTTVLGAFGQTTVEATPPSSSSSLPRSATASQLIPIDPEYATQCREACEDAVAAQTDCIVDSMCVSFSPTLHPFTFLAQRGEGPQHERLFQVLTEEYYRTNHACTCSSARFKVDFEACLTASCPAEKGYAIESENLLCDECTYYQPRSRPIST